MSFASKMSNAIQAAIITVVSVSAIIVLSGSALYAGSRATDYMLGLNKNTSIAWVGNHAKELSHGLHALLDASLAVKINS
jgi:hypothetical protein